MDPARGHKGPPGSWVPFSSEAAGGSEVLIRREHMIAIQNGPLQDRLIDIVVERGACFGQEQPDRAPPGFRKWMIASPRPELGSTFFSAPCPRCKLLKQNSFLMCQGELTKGHRGT